MRIRGLFSFALLNLSLLASDSFGQELPCVDLGILQTPGELAKTEKMMSDIFKTGLFQASLHLGHSDAVKWVETAHQIKLQWVDLPLPAEKQRLIQLGAAYSCFDSDRHSYYTFMNRTRFAEIQNTVIEQALLFHEICVLAGLETTGDYHLTESYLENRKSGIFDQYVSRKLGCDFSLFDAHSALLGSNRVVIGSADQDSGFVPLLNSKTRHQIYVQVIGNSSHLTTIKLIQGRLKTYRDSASQSIEGVDLMQDLLRDLSLNQLETYILQGYVNHTRGEFSKVFKLKSFQFRIRCQPVD